MSDQVTLLAGERQRGETRRAILACNDYLRMGPGRSLAKLIERYRSAAETPPTKRLKTLKEWSTPKRYGWQARADEYDAETERIKNERRREVLETGLALDFERVTELKRLFDLLSGELYKMSRRKYINLWLADVKQIGRGDDAERVDLRRFNAPIVDQIRGVLGDLAAETGGRAGKVDITTGGGQAIKFITVVEPTEEGE
jgi:hypothetical protein